MYLFFVRRYNDVDHIVPIIYRMAKDGVKDIKVFCINFQFDIKRDFRISFLTKEFNIKAEYYYFSKTVGFRHFLLVTIARFLLFYQYRINGNSRIAKHYLGRFYNKSFYQKYCGASWASSFIESLKPKVIVFDMQKPKPFLKPLIEEAKKRRIPLLLVPHGINVATNELTTNKAVSDMQDANYGKNWKDFDFACTQFPLARDRMIKNGFSNKRIKVLGSTRYCHNWRKILGEIMPATKYYHDSGGIINVVYMDHIESWRFNKESVIDSINRLASVDSINLVVKPTTGRTYKSSLGDDLGVVTRKNCPNITFEENVPSNSLIEWADVVICTISSIGIEVLLQNKLLIHPQYFHGNTLLYSEMNACLTVHNYEELETAIMKVQAEPDYRPHSQEDADKFIEYVVYGGKKDRDVLGEYKDFILSKAHIT